MSGSDSTTRAPGTPGGREPETASGPVDVVLERRLGAILRIGVTVSSVSLALGLVMSLAVGSTPFVVMLMNAGLLILIATPIARVATSVVQYALERDWRFVALTSIVLLELAAGIVAALVFHRRL